MRCKIRTWAVLGAFFGGVVGAPVAESAPRPNILLVIADDWSWPHAGAYGAKWLKTPHFDGVAKSGALFRNAFCVSPSCSPSRASILTGKYVHQLEEGASLWGTLPKKFPTYTELLANAGYAVGLTGKGWGPGQEKVGGWTHNPAGQRFPSFREFLATVKEDQPFCFWAGSTDPHRPYEAGAGQRAGLDPASAVVPPFYPDHPEIRSDLLDYAVRVQRFDAYLGDILKTLQESGRSTNTLVLVTSDNGMPFPRCKANLYEAGIHLPLAMSWPGHISPGQTNEDMVSFVDLAPTILEAADIPIPSSMVGRSTLERTTPRAYSGPKRPDWPDQVFVERERHANVRKGDLAYPVRGVRTKEFLYLINLKPDRWPAGDPEKHVAVGPFGDIDASPTKDFLMQRQAEPNFAKWAQLSLEKRPAEELYDLRSDPWSTTNVVEEPARQATRDKLARVLQTWRQETKDPRLDAHFDGFEKYPYYGDRPATKAAKAKKGKG